MKLIYRCLCLALGAVLGSGCSDSSDPDDPVAEYGLPHGRLVVDGSILACPNIDRSFAQGNIHEDDFCDVWENRYQQFRDRSWMRAGDCVGCKEWRLCQGNSFHLWDPRNQRTRICDFREFGLDEPVSS